MENQNIPSGQIDMPVDKPKKLRKKFPLPAVCIIVTMVFCVALAVALAPTVYAQARAEQGSSYQYTSILRNAFDYIQRNYVEEVNSSQLFEGAMTGMLNSLGDPYSVYLPETEMKDINDTTQGSFGGVGLYVSKQIRNDGKPSYLEVASPIEDTPGWRAGINSGDLIIDING